MIDKIKSQIADRNVLILGFGKEGQSTYYFLRKIYSDKNFTIADQKSDHQEAKSLALTDPNLTLKLGEDYLNSIQEDYFIFKSPGINIQNIELKPGVIVSSQTQLFLQSYAKQTIGITGTKGKSTTSSLTYHLLEKAGKDCLLIGNIGIPPFLSIDKIKAETIIVFELSAHQLESISVAPHIAILLNIFEEHLDYFQSFENYRQKKLNICRKQIKGDILITNIDQPDHCEIKLKKVLSSTLGFSLKPKNEAHCFLEQNTIYLKINSKARAIIETKELTSLIGEHNLYNIMASILACHPAGISPLQIKEGIKSFKSLEHRLEFVGIYKGIIFYNDSISTIPESTIEAVKSLPETDTLILGGFDRGIHYDSLILYLSNSNVRNFIFMGPAGKRMKSLFEKLEATAKYLVEVNSLAEAFDVVIQQTPKGKICLLSPAAASYDAFKDFEERGTIYKKIARNL